MLFPTAIYCKRFARYEMDFINLPKKERDLINSPYVNSKFLRIGSNVGYSCGRYYHIQELDWETTELTEIENIHEFMKSLYLEWNHLFDKLKNFPELLRKFQETFKNDS